MHQLHLWLEGLLLIFTLNASVLVMHACSVKNPVHAGDIFAQSKATGKWSCSCCSITLVHCPTSRRSWAAAASCFSANLDPHTCLGDCCLHLRARPACIYVEESALKVTATQQPAGTHSFTSMYGLRSYQAFGLIIARRVLSNMLLIGCHQSLQQDCNTTVPVTVALSGAHWLACAVDQYQLQQDVANLKIDSKRREVRLTKMLSPASQKTQSERELGQVFKAVLVQGDKGCRSCVSHTLHAQHVCIQEHHMHSTCM